MAAEQKTSTVLVAMLVLWHACMRNCFARGFGAALKQDFLPWCFLLPRYAVADFLCVVGSSVACRIGWDRWMYLPFGKLYVCATDIIC